MKKTIIMLLALAAGAQASVSTYDDLKGSSANAYISQNQGYVAPGRSGTLELGCIDYWYYTTNYIAGVGFTLNPSMLSAYGDDTVVLSIQGTNESVVSFTLGDLKSQMLTTNGAFAVVMNYDVNKRTSTFSLFNEAGASSTKTGSMYSVASYTLHTDLLYAASVLYGQGSYECFDETGYEGPVYPGDASLAQQLMSATPKAEGGVTPEEPAVPEPTSATLSLLALSALAARRRRR
ncbi:MAG: PEP-CTERM sorting domain-containing protein [Akkermansia sp.]|nr:PEP-CTERM sorting domain-containing protein [Akkermansia sp.]